MFPSPFRGSSPPLISRIGLAALFSLLPPTAEARPRDGKAPPWRAFGKVTDQDGRPFAGVEVRAYCGMGTLRQTGVATSAADGRYELDFWPGISMPNREGAAIQAATISASRPGYFEGNLNRQGGCSAADGMPADGQMKLWDARKDRLFLPGRPLEIDFTMRPAARVSGKLVDERGMPLARYGVGLSGADPPSMGAVRGAEADDQGRFALEDIPTTFRYQFVVRKPDPKPPWDDSWAGAALQFERPERGDLRARFGSREIRIQDFVLRVAGPGQHGREAVPVAGNAGLLDLTGEAEVSDTLLSAKTATLTVRNTPRPDVSRSLIRDAVPSAATESPTRLTRTRPDEAGNFVIAFENPRGLDLEPGKHQVILQVLVGASRRPIRERIFRQIDAHAGRYEVPLRVPPEWIDDSRVSLSFVTIQPDHDAWVRSFFLEGKGTSYKGLWAGDGGPIPAIPLVPKAQ